MNSNTRSRLAKPVSRMLRAESGSALVEMAITLPLMLGLLLGAVELGDLAYKATEMSNAARAGAQYAAMNGGNFTDCKFNLSGGTCDTTSGVFKAAKADAPWASSKCSNFAVTATSSCTCSDGTACASGSEYTCSSTPVVTVTVTTTASCGGIASVLGLFSANGNAFNLQGYAQQEVLK